MAHKVLIVDDDRDFVEATANLLTAQGYQVQTAPEGKTGLAKAREIRPDLILLDVMMTSHNEGFDVAREISRERNLRGVPVVMITGVRKEMDLPFGFEPDDDWLPVKGVLEKPVNPKVLLKTVADILAAGGTSAAGQP